jgi:hypothetical protein
VRRFSIEVLTTLNKVIMRNLGRLLEYVQWTYFLRSLISVSLSFLLVLSLLFTECSHTRIGCRLDQLIQILFVVLLLDIFT